METWSHSTTKGQEYSLTKWPEGKNLKYAANSTNDDHRVFYRMAQETFPFSLPPPLLHGSCNL